MGTVKKAGAQIVKRSVGTATGLIRLTLEVPAGYGFYAGQYLNVVHPDGTQIPLSIASAPGRLPTLELHYQPTPGDTLSAAMDQCLAHDELLISPAAGTVRCPSNSASLTIIAGGSGASLAFCLAQQRATDKSTALTQVLWCADHADEFYAVPELSELCAVIQVADPRRDARNSAFKRLTALALTDHYILSGSPSFVYAMTDQLAELGLPIERLQSDVFSYAPRETPRAST